MTLPAVRPLAVAERRHAGALLAAAFHDDPLFAWLIPREPARRAWLRAFMRASVTLAASRDAAWAVGDDGRVDAVMTAFDPDRYPPSRWARAAMALKLAPRLLIGQPPIGRGRAAARVLSATEDAHLDGPHVYLMQIGVDGARQGRGLGKQAMGWALDQASAAGRPVWLETSNPRNLAYYRRLGFEVVDELVLPPVPPVWTMVAHPNA